jgi:hypothetical protein
VRDRDGDRLPLEVAVQKMTSATADLYGLGDRGRLLPGMVGDVNVIDMDRLQLHRPERVVDLPGDAGRLIQRADGYVTTIKSGQVVMSAGETTGEVVGAGGGFGGGGIFAAAAAGTVATAGAAGSTGISGGVVALGPRISSTGGGGGGSGTAANGGAGGAGGNYGAGGGGGGAGDSTAGRVGGVGGAGGAGVIIVVEW